MVAHGVGSTTGVVANPRLRFLRAGLGNISVGANPATESTGCLTGGMVLQLKPCALCILHENHSTPHGHNQDLAV